MAENKNNQNIKNILANIKSKLIFRKIFCNILEKKLLNIIRFNKNFQNKLNKNIIDYKKRYLKIEIEIIPHKYSYGKFINIDKDNRQYYHIYFNDNEEEAKINVIPEKAKITKIKIIIDYEAASIKGLFQTCKCIKKINFIKFKRQDFMSMTFMFSGCKLLEEINLSNFYTDKLTDMSYMFVGCSSLKKINFSNFNTNNVTNMSYMFRGCILLKEINLYNFNTNNVINMSSMFAGCSSLKNLNLSNFNNTKLVNMSYMFSNCSLLQKLNLSGFGENNNMYISGIFFGCPLRDLNCSNLLIINEYFDLINF